MSMLGSARVMVVTVGENQKTHFDSVPLTLLLQKLNLILPLSIRIHPVTFYSDYFTF